MEAIAKLHPELDTNNTPTIKPHRRCLPPALPARQHRARAFVQRCESVAGRTSRRGYTLAISTGKSRAGLEQSISEHRLADYFATTRCAGENKSKPHPEMLHEILEQLNFSATQTLMIGDSEHDLKMANNANMQCIGVTHGVHDATTLNKHKPLTCLADITELSAFLSHNYASTKSQIKPTVGKTS